MTYLLINIFFSLLFFGNHARKHCVVLTLVETRFLVLGSCVVSWIIKK